MKGLCLISTGIDSPVAAYKMQKLNWKLDFVHFKTDERAIPILKKQIKQLGKPARLFIVPQDYMSKLSQKSHKRVSCILCKRMMYRLAEALAHRYGHNAIITGENLGQVASQTLDNLIVLSVAAKIPILRPLLPFEKNDIIDIAKQIGTYELSISLKENCPFLPKNPATRSRIRVIEQEESDVDFPKLIEETLAKLRVLEIRPRKGLVETKRAPLDFPVSG